MLRYLFYFSCILAAVASTCVSAQAIKLKKIVKEVGNIVKQAPKIVNPVTTPIQIVTGRQNPLKVKEFIAQQGQAIGSVVNSTRQLSAMPHQAAGKLVAEVGGDKARIIFEFGTAADRFQKEFVFTAAQTGAQIMQGQDPLIALSMPLAAALRDAHAKYSGQAKPLPPETIQLLSHIIPIDLLQKARYTSDNIKISLPSIINTAQSAFGHDYAVTIDNIIVFSREPDFDELDDVVHLAHELYHVRQYREWGIDQFAFNYLKNYRAVEDQADAAESFARSFLTQIANGQAPVPQVTHQSAASFSTQRVQTPLGQTAIFVPSPDSGSGQAIQQPVIYSPPPPQFVAQCFINGQRFLIHASNAIIAPHMGNAQVGTREPPLSPACFHDIAHPSGRMCVLFNGQIFAGGPVAVGQCTGCAPGTC